MPDPKPLRCLGGCRDGKGARVSRPFCADCWDALPEVLRLLLTYAEQTRDADVLRYVVIEAVAWCTTERGLIG